MKKFLSFALVLAMLFALAVPAMAEGNLYSKGNEWYFDAEEAGTLKVKDNKNTYSYDVKAGPNFLGLQKVFTGQLKFVSFEAEHVCDFVKKFVKAEVSVTIQNVTGNTNPYSFVIKEEYKHECECGKTLENTFEYIREEMNLPNNYKGDVKIDDYTVYIKSFGNTEVEELYIK